MNKIIKLLIFLLFASNIFAMRIIPTNIPNKSKNILPVTVLPLDMQVIAKPNSQFNFKKPPVILQPLVPKSFAQIVTEEQNLDEPDFLQLALPLRRPSFLQYENIEQIEPESSSDIFTQNEVIKTTKMRNSDMQKSSTHSRSSKKKEGTEEEISALDQDMYKLMGAITTNYMCAIERYLKEKADLFDEITFNECNVLTFSIQYGKAETVLILLQEHKFQINTPDRYGCTALMFAAKNKKMIGVVHKLLEQGGIIDQEDNEKNTALMYAIAAADNIEIVQALLEKGANYCKINDFGESVLAQAILNQNIEIVKLLLAFNKNSGSFAQEFTLQIDQALEIIEKQIAGIKYDFAKLKAQIEAASAESEETEDLEEAKNLDNYERLREYKDTYQDFKEMRDMLIRAKQQK